MQNNIDGLCNFSAISHYDTTDDDNQWSKHDKIRVESDVIRKKLCAMIGLNWIEVMWCALWRVTQFKDGHFCVHNRPLLILNFNQKNRVYTITTDFFKTYLNIITDEAE